MRCGNKNCENNRVHDTVEQVRECYVQTAGLGSYLNAPANLTTPPTSPGRDVSGSLDWGKFKEIPAGYYATPSLTGNNDLDFWHVQDGKGRWEGYKFIKRVIGGRGDQGLPKDSKKKVKSERIKERVTQARAFQAILDAGIGKSHELFGIELKFCRECGTHLTDELSRELGIGPDCRSK